jgi:hypothetical protein
LFHHLLVKVIFAHEMNLVLFIVLIFEVRFTCYFIEIIIFYSRIGTDVSCTQENLYRMTRALFPPSLSVLKQICWRGYIDGLKFLQTRSN